MSSHEIITRYITGRNMSRCGSVNKCRYVCFCLGQTQITYRVKRLKRRY